MGRSSLSITVTLSLALFLAACGARSVGGTGDGGGPPPDAAAPPDGALPDAAVPPPQSHGYVQLLHLQEQASLYPQEYVTLSAAFYAEEWDPFRVQLWPLLDTVQTPDGVTCELTYVSGMDGPIPPQPPPELNAGEIYAWPGQDGDVSLHIAFNGTTYSIDQRSRSGTAPWPDWLDHDPLDLRFETTGSAQVEAFANSRSLPLMPEILAPPPSLDEPLTPDPDGTHRIAWTAEWQDLIEVAFHFNMDWDEGYIRCYPPPGQTELRLPHDWVTQLSWGYGELMVYAVNEWISGNNEWEHTVREIRVRQQPLNIAVWD